MNRIKEKVRKEIVAECEDDSVGLWEVIWNIVYEINGGDYPMKENDRSDPEEVRRLALEIVAELLELGEIAAVFTNLPFEDYRLEAADAMTPSEILERIGREWDVIGRKPTMAEIVAFSTPDEVREIISQQLLI